MLILFTLFSNAVNLGVEKKLKHKTDVVLM